MQIIKVTTLVAVVAIYMFSPLSGVASKGGVVPVELTKQGARYLLLRGGKPYEVKGAGLEFSSVERFASHGGNSFRTWRTDNAHFTGMEQLDEAARHDVTVALCIEIGRERHGFDYDDEEAVARVFAGEITDRVGEIIRDYTEPEIAEWIEDE